MDYEFFLSYTRANNDDYLRQFFHDLSEEIREARGLPQAAEVGFLDQRDIELGTHWENEIEAALRIAKAMVCIYSPGYFRSDYCGREWRVFYDRCDHSLRLGTYPSLPPLLKPVPWIAPLPTQLAPIVQGLQYGKGDPASMINQKGLKYVMKQMGTYRAVYVDYVAELAREVLREVDAYPLPPLPVPSLAETRSAFAIETVAAPAGRSPVPGTLSTAKHVRFFVAAADPQVFQGRRSPEPYLERGGAEWKPFFPRERRSIGALAQNIVSDPDLDLTSDVAILDASIRNAIQRAWEERKMVVLLVDGWTVFATEESRDILAGLDRENYYNCSVLVPWNEEDTEIAPLRADIEQSLRQTFHFRMRLGSTYYRDALPSLDALKAALRDVIVLLQAEMRIQTTPVKPVPLGPAQPSVSVA